jgi:hypothetical protein
MSSSHDWSRRQFMAASAAAAAFSSRRFSLWAQQPLPPSVMPPPGVITGGIQPLLEGHTARPLRYTAEGTDFVIRNGREFFNRPLYGPNSAFRVDAGDLPEFSLYLPGHGGNLKLGISAAGRGKWLAQADEVVARYRPGRMIYEIRDAILGDGSLALELLTAGTGSGLLLRVESHGVPGGAAITWAFGGVSGRKGRRNGDIGCELEPVSRFFQLRPEECAENRFVLDEIQPPDGRNRPASRLLSPACELRLTFPVGSKVRIADAREWETPVLPSSEALTSGDPALPILTGWSALDNAAPQYLTVQRIPAQGQLAEAGDPARAFAERSAQVAALAATLRMTTPDASIDAASAALGIAADGIWDSAQQCVMHGGVAWRVPLAGWRGPYCLDLLGNHGRARQHLRHWLAFQNTTPIPSSSPATGPYDANTHLSRKESLLHSNGDLSHSHYDMNLVFFDVLLRHLRWTGDLEFAREVWPALQRHLAWEMRLFRRVFKGRDGQDLPLYEAYAAIWASDNLQYNGGGATHSSAYMLFALRAAAEIAGLLHESPEPYESEARLLDQAMQELLWLPAQGAFAESKDILGAQTVYNNPALWTVYHAIDSEATTPRQAWQMIAERLSVLRRVPVHGEGVPPGGWYMLSCSNWLPYLWSLNLLALAENVHLALAMWQAGMNEEAFLLLKGNLLDSMFQGLTPGNFHMTSALDVHRQEAQRDSGDPIGIVSRALVEGLFGVQPDLLRNRLTVRPGFPAEWNQASLKHPGFDLAWRREGLVETLEFTSRFSRAVPLQLVLKARTARLPVVTLDGSEVVARFDPEAIGSPQLLCSLPAQRFWKIRIEWRGEAPAAAPAARSYKLGEPLVLPPGVSLAQIDDPQGCLNAGQAAAAGFHTVFARMRQGDCEWSMPISFTVQPATVRRTLEPAGLTARQMDALDLAPLLQHQISEIFTRPYTEPRSPFCSLALPEQLMGGWANMDMRASIDDTGLRAAGGMLQTATGIPFRTPAGDLPNCLFLSRWRQDRPAVEIPLQGRAEAVYLLMTGTTFPQASRMRHGAVTVRYAEGDVAMLPLENPETWWPIEQDYLLDDYLFVDGAPLPVRVDLRTGKTRVLESGSFKGKGGEIRGGAATILGLTLDPKRALLSLKVEADLYGIVMALLGVTLVRPRA